MKKKIFKITKWQIDIDKRKANTKYKVPEEAGCYTIDIDNGIFNINSFYSFFLQDGNSLENLNSLGWSIRIYKGRIQIIAVDNADPELNMTDNGDYFGSVSADYEKVQCPAGKSLIVFYENID